MKELPQWAEAIDCTSGIHCDKCRLKEARREWRASFAESKGIEGGPDFECPHGKPWIEEEAQPKKTLSTVRTNVPAKSPQVVTRPVKSVSQIGINLAAIIEKKTGRKIECGACKSEVLRLNTMTAQAVLSEIDQIAQGIIDRGMKFGKWYHQLANKLAPGMVKEEVRKWIREACAAEGNAESRFWSDPNSVLISNTHSRAEDMEILTCHFNPMGYKKPVENYWKFKEHLGDLPVVSVELSYDGNFIDPDAIHITGDPSKHGVWQKEALLNIALEHSTSPYVAWVDADILFTDPDWHKKTVEALDEYSVVQCWSEMCSLTKDGKGCERSAISYMKKGVGDLSTNGHPGFAWAACRCALPKGFYPLQVAGSGDVDMLDAFTGYERQGWYTKGWSEGRVRHYYDWRNPTYAATQGRVGVVQGSILHLWHGAWKDRQYVERREKLKDLKFDPEKDVTLDDQGLVTLTGQNPELEAWIRGYFARRKEDG